MRSEEAEATGRRGWMTPALLLPALVLGSAHWWRAGDAGMAAACLLWAAGCVTRRAWMRPLSAAMLVLLTAEWLLTAQTLVQIRTAVQAPWMRLAAILIGVTAEAAVAAAVVWTGPGRAWFCRGRTVARMQAAAFLLTAVPLFFMARFAPHLLLLERVARGFGVVQALAAGGWSAWVCAALADGRRAFHVRMRVWRLFSVVFFVQFALALAGWSLFAMTGEWHLPVPGIVVAGALYRGTTGFMPLLFAVSVLLAGAAWCSHLCYFGSWDAWAASGARPSSHPGPVRWRVLSLIIVCAAALLLSLAPVSAAVVCGAALGVVMLPVAALVSRRRGWAAYCTLVCPLGLLACVAGRLSPWRIRRTAACTGCGACTRACRYGALDEARPASGTPGLSCTLCRDCLNVCPHRGLCLTWFGLGADGTAERAFVVLMAAMHALFLFSAMV